MLQRRRPVTALLGRRISTSSFEFLGLSWEGEPARAIPRRICQPPVSNSTAIPLVESTATNVNVAEANSGLQHVCKDIVPAASAPELDAYIHDENVSRNLPDYAPSPTLVSHCSRTVYRSADISNPVLPGGLRLGHIGGPPVGPAIASKAPPPPPPPEAHVEAQCRHTRSRRGCPERM